ncbi:M24 family metallopeptidase [Lutispora sp.]|uniref:M24 family metallopeptidase n=1 Tax=Lutispora sp. TaxID=2828727 RepID=UPI002B21E128|nr:Xaa-Pro peptidase family protein [Lutispora sp.]MEA4963442.1 Xaa-Pro peptidase family protein [Lutispora sp.]
MLINNLSRYDRLKRYMEEEGLDVTVVISPENTLYFAETYIMTQTDIRDRLAIVVLPLSGDPVMIACGIEQGTVDAETWIKDKRYYIEFQESPIQFLADVLDEKGLSKKKVGIELDYLMAHYYKELVEKMPGADFVSCTRLFDKVKMIKEDKEIAILSEAANITRESLEKALREVHPGCTERLFSSKVKINMLKGGADKISFFVMGSGAKSIQVHALPDDTVMEDGEVMRLDFGGLFKGNYQSDFARTVMIGKLNPKYLDIYNWLTEVYQHVISCMKIGVTAAELYDICSRKFKEYNLPFSSPHIGHSLGIGLHEFPMLSPKENFALEENMVFNIEPVVVAEGRMFHMEDLIQITPEGPKILSNHDFNPGVLSII